MCIRDRLITLATGNNNNGRYSGQMRAFYNNNGTWEQIGHNIGGKRQESAAGWHKTNHSLIAVNDAGDIIAMANPLDNRDSCNKCGRVIILKRENGIWSQLGNEIFGTNGGAHYGLSIALNSAGNVIAIGDSEDDSTGTNKGIVHIYEFNGSDWVAKGNTGKINPPDGSDTTPKWGWSVDLDSSGDTVVIGANTHSQGSGSDKGKVIVYEYNAPNWIQKGSALTQNNANGYFGHSVSINSTGNMILAGQPFYVSRRGRAYAFTYDGTSNDWINSSYNCTLCETVNQRRFGWALALNDSGNTAVIGEPDNYNVNNLGDVSVWRLINQDVSGVLRPTWMKIGSDIVSTDDSDRTGWSVDISANGNIVAFGAPNNEKNGGNDRGIAKVFQLDSDNSREPFEISIVDSLSLIHI